MAKTYFEIGQWQAAKFVGWYSDVKARMAKNRDKMIAAARAQYPGKRLEWDEQAGAVKVYLNEDTEKMN